MVQQVLEERREGARRHDLIGIVEISLIVGEPQGDPLQDAGVDLAGRHAPLLGGVRGVVVLEEKLRVAPDVRVGVPQHLRHRGELPAGERLGQLAFERLRLLGRIEGVDGGEVEGRGGVLSAPYGAAGELVRLPRLVAAHEVVELLFLGVEGVGAVLLHQEPVLVHVVIHIPADVVPALPDDDLLPSLRQFPRDHRAGQAAAYHQTVHLKTLRMYP